MNFKLEINCDNAAYANDPRPQLAHNLHNLAEQIEAGNFGLDITVVVIAEDPKPEAKQNIKEVNGNTVGTAVFTY